MSTQEILAIGKSTVSTGRNYGKNQIISFEYTLIDVSYDSIGYDVEIEFQDNARGISGFIKSWVLFPELHEIKEALIQAYDAGKYSLI